MIKLLAIFALSHSIYAIDLSKPQMLNRMLDFKAFQAKHTCHDPSDLKELNSQYRNSFIATVSCQISCEGEASSNYEVDKEFTPRDLSLSAGDGSSNDFTMWRSLGITIDAFKKDLCLKKAKSACKEISQLKVLSIGSGNWSQNKDINCSDKKLTLSPFDPSFKLKLPFTQRISVSSASPFGIMNQESNKNDLTEFIKTNEQIESLQKKACKKSIQVSTCFGDCIFDDKKAKVGFVETLSTSAHFGTDQFNLCLDDFNLHQKSSDVRVIQCEKIIWEYIRASKAAGESCAALRFNHNCSTILK